MGILDKIIPKPLRKVFNVTKITKVFNWFKNLNPWVALGIFAIGWLFLSNRRPDRPDFGDSDFNNFEKGIY